MLHHNLPHAAVRRIFQSLQYHRSNLGHPFVKYPSHLLASSERWRSDLLASAGAAVQAPGAPDRQAATDQVQNAVFEYSKRPSPDAFEWSGLIPWRAKGVDRRFHWAEDGPVSDQPHAASEAMVLPELSGSLVGCGLQILTTADPRTKIELTHR